MEMHVIEDGQNHQTKVLNFVLVKNIERFKVCRLSSVVRCPLSIVRRLSSVPIVFPHKYISTSH